MGRSNGVPPGPTGNIIFGHFAEYSRDPLGFLQRCAETYGGVSAFRLPGARFYLLSDPELIASVFAATNSKFINHGGMRTPLSRLLFGTGILTTEGDEWKRQRSLTFPSFHHSSVSTYAEFMVDETRKMLDAWPQNGRVSIFEEMTNLTLRILTRTLLRSSMSEKLFDITKAFLDLRDGFLLKHRLQSFGMLLPLPVKQKYRNAVSRLDYAVREIIAERRLDARAHDDLLSVLISAKHANGEPISDRQLQSEIKTFLFTGIFGAAHPLGWSSFLISRHEDVYGNLLAEIDDVLGYGEISVATVRKCVYAQWIVKEALRLYPPIWASGREAIVDTSVGGFSVPKGTQVIMSQWVTQRDPRFWRDPEVFDPGRWGENGSRPKYSYFPHGGGPRFCMGDYFAEMLSVIVITMTARRFRLRPASEAEIELIPSYALFPAGNVELQIARRGAARSASHS